MAPKYGPARSRGWTSLPQSTHGCHIAKLLGCYEQPLQPFIEQAIRAAYPVVLNIGCAEGYYAVGMARRMPATRVHAFDIDPAAQRVCAELAAKHGVADRVRIGARFTPDDFAAYAGQKTLVLCDIEGGEKDLLDPETAPALRGMPQHPGALRSLPSVGADTFRSTSAI